MWVTVGAGRGPAGAGRWGRSVGRSWGAGPGGMQWREVDSWGRAQAGSGSCGRAGGRQGGGYINVPWHPARRREQLPHLIREQGVPHSCPSRKPGREQYVLSEKPQEVPRGATPLGPAPGPPPAGAAGLTSAHAPAQTASCSPSVKGAFPMTSLAPSSLGQTARLQRVKGGAASNSTYKKDRRGSFLSVSLWWAVRGGELGCVCALSQDQSNICRTGPLLGSECRALLARARGSLAELPSVEGRRGERHL